MRLNKWQTVIITLLNVVIATLIVVIMLTGAGKGVPDGDNAGAGDVGTEQPPSDQTGGEVDPPEHIKLREASAGKAEGIVRETRLMGSGDETAVKVYFRSGVTYLFGNSTVADLDFDSYGGFLCIVNGAGTILSFTYFDGRITATCDLGDGYAVAAGGKLYGVDYAGNAAVKAQVSDKVLDVFAVDSGKLAAVTQPTRSSLRYTEYATAGDKWQQGHVTRIDGGYTLEYFDCYDFGGSRVISARAHSLPAYDAAAFFSFMPGGDAAAHYYGGGNANVSTPYAVMPFSAGYFAAVSKNGIATLLSVDYEFLIYHETTLGFTFSDASICYAGGKYYACFIRTDGAVTYEIQPDLAKSTLSALDGISLDTVAVSGAQRIAAGSVGRRDKSQSFALIDTASGRKKTFSAVNAAVYAVNSYDGKLTVVLSAVGGDALSAPSGNRDLYVLSVEPV